MIGKVISHYEIIEELGRGGMGEVYLAEDTKLKRKIALKFLPSRLITDKEIIERFEREAQTAAALNHPNIITVYEIGEFEGRSYIAMEYVEGESLREKMVYEGAKSPLSRGDLGGCAILQIDNIINISTQICEGLHEAHQVGIVHRDIKPENILIDKSGRVTILDFGLARMKGVTKLTKDASTLGTLKYMSPEQYQNREVDHRTDIWSFGVVLFEMLTGQLPFQGEYEAAVMYSVLNEEPVSVSSIRKDVPKNLEQIVNKSLEKNPAMRYQSTQEVLEELKKPISSITVSEKKEKSIVVLPFVNMSPDPEQEYFSDGLTEEIITDLSHIHDLLVISRNSAMTFKGTKKRTKEIAREVNVQYVLEGSVRKAGNNLRITAQLIDSTTDAHLWAEKYSGTLDDVFDIQEKVSRSIVNSLKVKLTSKEDNQIAERPIVDIQAYECYFKARQETWRSTEDALNRSLRYISEALKIIGDNVLLYAALAETYFVFLHIGVNNQDYYFEKLKETKDKILELDPKSEHGYLWTGAILTKEPGAIKEALRNFMYALEINPNNSFILLFYVFWAAQCGKLSWAEPYVQKMIDIDPLSALSYTIAGYYHTMSGRFYSAVELYHKTIDIEPESTQFLFQYAHALAIIHKKDEACTAIENQINNFPDNGWTWLAEFLMCALNGQKSEVNNIVRKELISTAKFDETFSWFMAECYALLEFKDEAVNWLENAVNRGFLNYPLFNEYDPFLENIRCEERFKKLMKRVKKEWENFEV